MNARHVHLHCILALSCFGLAGAAHAADAGAEKGRQAIGRYGCIACHDVPGVKGPGGGVGPPLEHIAKRVYIAGVLANTRENMVRWLRNPPAVDPRTAMPNMGVSEADARDIAAYLETLD